MTHLKTALIACLLAVGLIACAEDTATETLMGIATDLQSQRPSAADLVDDIVESVVADPDAPGSSARVRCEHVCIAPGLCEWACCGFGTCCTSQECWPD